MNAIIAAIVAFLVGFVASYLAQWPTPPRTLWRMWLSRRRRERRCYTIQGGKTYIVPSSSTDKVSRYLSEHDMSCVEAVVTMLRESGYRDGDDFQVYFQDPTRDTVPPSVRTQNLVLVCGPKRNRLVESVLRDFPNLLSSVSPDISQGAAFLWRGKTYTPTDTRDYALVAVKRNPYNSKRRLVLLFGLKSIGTKGAGSFYADRGWSQARAEIADKLETRGGEIETILSIDHTPDYHEITHIAPVVS